MPDARFPLSPPGTIAVSRTQLLRIVPAGKLRVGRIAIDPKKLFHRHVLGQMLAKEMEE